MLIVQFENHDLDLFEHQFEGIEVKIYRRLQREPLPGMSQPVPFGGHMGMATVLELNDRVSPGAKRYELLLGQEVVDSGVTDERGRGYLRLPLPPNSALGIPGGPRQVYTLQIAR